MPCGQSRALWLLADPVSCPVASPALCGASQIQSRALWRLRASLAETEAFSDVVRMEHFASSPELPSSMASFESNALPVAGERRAVPARADSDGPLRTPVC